MIEMTLYFQNEAKRNIHYKKEITDKEFENIEDHYNANTFNYEFRIDGEIILWMNSRNFNFNTFKDRK